MTKNPSRSKQSPTFDRTYQEEIGKAFGRIGQNWHQKFDWLLRFAQCDLDSLSQGEVIDLGFELNCLGDLRYENLDLENPIHHHWLSMKDWEGQNRFVGKSGEEVLRKIMVDPSCFRPVMKLPSLGTIKDLQRPVLEIIEQILKERIVNLKLPPLLVSIISSEKRDAVRVFSRTKGPLGLLFHNLAFFLITGANRIRRCPECQLIFFADRKNKMSCSARCQNTAAVRRIRLKAKTSKRSTQKKLIRRKS